MRQIALRSLLHDRAKLLTALAGIAFATVLMLVQIGVYVGFLRSASTLIRGLGGDVWVMARGTQQIEHGEPLSPGTFGVVQGNPCVQRARPIEIGLAPYRTASGGLHHLQVVGFDPGGPKIVPWSMMRGLPADLGAPDRVALDVSELTKFDIHGDPIGAAVEIARSTVHVAVLTEGIRSFNLLPYVFARGETARRLLAMGEDQVTYWVLDVRHRSCVDSLVRDINRHPSLEAHSTNEWANLEEDYLVRQTGIGTALGFVALLGFVVGVAIVGQTLFAMTRDRARELGMLKAVGAFDHQLLGFVVWQAGALFFAGALLGTVLAFCVKRALTGLSLPVIISPSTLLVGLGSLLVMCGVASIASMRVVLRLDPVEVLR